SLPTRGRTLARAGQSTPSANLLLLERARVEAAPGKAPRVVLHVVVRAPIRRRADDELEALAFDQAREVADVSFEETGARSMRRDLSRVRRPALHELLP